MKISKWVIDSFLQEKGVSIHQYEDRCLGKSTGLMYKYIGEALFNPLEWIKITDHHNQKRTNIELLQKIKKKIEDDNLKYFRFDNINNYIQYSPYYESDE